MKFYSVLLICFALQAAIADPGASATPFNATIHQRLIKRKAQLAKRSEKLERQLKVLQSLCRRGCPRQKKTEMAIVRSYYNDVQDIREVLKLAISEVTRAPTADDPVAPKDDRTVFEDRSDPNGTGLWDDAADFDLDSPSTRRR